MENNRINSSVSPKTDVSEAPRSSDETAQQKRQPLSPGTIVGDYRIIAYLSQGGFGITYQARAVSDETLVVIKELFPLELAVRVPGSDIIAPASPQDEHPFQTALNEFVEEITVLMGLKNPGIVSIIAGFEANDTAYYVMPFIEGEPLRLTEKPTLDRGLRAIEARQLKYELRILLLALEYMSQHNIVHRDIKPDNILIDSSGRPVLIDFGSARQLQKGKVFTNIFTPAFCAPEQATAANDTDMSGKIGPWTDIYSLGATFYYMITRMVPPRAELRAVSEPDPYVPLVERSELKGLYGYHFLKSIDRALQLNPQDRWKSPKEWRESLESGILPPTPGIVKRTRLLMGGALFLLFIFAGFTLWSQKEKKQATEIYNISLRFTENMLHDFNEELADIPKATHLQNLLGRNIKNYLTDMERQPAARDRNLQRALTTAWYNLGSVSIQQGKLPEAQTALDRASEIVDPLVKEPPGDLHLQYSQALIRLKRALVAQKRNNVKLAEEKITQAISNLKALSAQVPTNPGFQCSLGQAMGIEAEIAKTQGDETLRRDILVKTETLYRNLVLKYPQHTQVRIGLAQTLQALSDQAAEQDDLESASRYQNEAKSLFSELATEEPYNLSSKKGLATAYCKIGSMYDQLSQTADTPEQCDAYQKKAMRALNRCLSLTHELEAMDRLHSDYPSLLGAAKIHIVSLHLRKGEFNQAEAVSSAMLQAAEKLKRLAPQNTEYEQLRAYAFRGLALSHQASPKNNDKAIEDFEQYRAITQKLMRKTPNSTQLCSMCADALEISADDALRRGDANQAGIWFQQATTILQTMIKRNPERQLYIERLKKIQEKQAALPKL